jgi:hypothetical protein
LPLTPITNIEPVDHVELPLLSVVPESKAPVALPLSHIPVAIETGLDIINFSEFDFTRNSFTMDATVWFYFDAEKIPLKTIEAFTFNKGEILLKHEPILQKRGKKTLARYTVNVKFKADLNMYNFPFDAHILRIIILNTALKSEAGLLVATQDTLSLPYVEAALGWKRYATGAQGGIIEQVMPLHDELLKTRVSGVEFDLYVRRSNMTYAFLIVLPMLLFVLFGLCVFCLNPFDDEIDAWGIFIATLTAFVLQRFSISSLLPQVEYFMIVDYLFFIFLSLLSIMFAISYIIIFGLCGQKSWLY